jgi:hypothetical protein
MCYGACVGAYFHFFGISIIHNITTDFSTFISTVSFFSIHVLTFFGKLLHVHCILYGSVCLLSNTH